MARTTEIPVHGIMTPVIQMDLPAEQLEDTMRAEIAADRAEDARDHAEEAKIRAEDAANRAVGAVAGVATFNGRSGEVKPQTGDYTAKMVGAAPLPVFVAATMLASGWSSNTYSFEETYPHASYNISIEVAPTATAEQFEAFGGAMICGSADSNIATALGDVPTMDIPIIIKVVAK